ncbi:MAG: fumarate hydratase [Candidatus Omnitrophota bacterium]
MRKIMAREIERKVEELCYKANIIMRPDVARILRKAYASEKKPLSRGMLKILIDNAEIAKKEKLPLCQDTGIAAVFVEIGEDAHVIGRLSSAVNRGVERAYTENNFRKSVVLDPITRVYKNTNTPAALHVNIVRGKKIKITVMPKGFGSENKSRVAMLGPTSGEKGVVDFAVETVKLAGPDACPPYILGVGIGGTMDTCALLSKLSLLRPIDQKNPKERLRKIENKILKKVNSLGIGVMGLGGPFTALGVNVEVLPTHIAGMPVAVSLSCHSLRSASGTI